MTTTFAKLAGLYLTAAIAANSSSPTTSSLSVSVDVPSITLPSTTAGRNFIRLPTVDYTLSINSRCGKSLSPSSLAISVADTRIRISGSEIETEEPTVVQLRIPANQIPPLALDDFCVAANNTVEPSVSTNSDNRQQLISAAMSAQISLLCVDKDDSEQSMTYASQPLNVTIVCGEALLVEDDAAE